MFVPTSPSSRVMARLLRSRSGSSQREPHEVVDFRWRRRRALGEVPVQRAERQLVDGLRVALRFGLRLAAPELAHRSGELADELFDRRTVFVGIALGETVLVGEERAGA